MAIDKLSQKRVLPVEMSDNVAHLRQVAEVLNNVMNGGLNSVGEVTFTPSMTTTDIDEPRISAYSVILLMPLTANAATAMQSVYITTTNGTATINHPSDAATDQDFRYLVIG